MFGWFSKKKEDKSEKRSEVESTRKDIGSEDDEKGVIDIFDDSVNNPLSWKDKTTGLIWEVKNRSNYNDTYSFDEAKRYAENLSIKLYDGSNRWRVPTVDELMTLGSAKLFDYRDRGLKYGSRKSWREQIESFRNGKVFVKRELSGIMNYQIETWYWSSTAVEDYTYGYGKGETKISRMTNLGWVVSFFEGGNYHNSKDVKNSVICVRDR
jgi:hypothetical protein